MKFKPGARAAIVISEHYVNMNRVVTLVEKLPNFDDGTTGWLVSDGKQFKGYNSAHFPARVLVYSQELAIEQWKLRLLDDDDDVVIRDDIEYLVERD